MTSGCYANTTNTFIEYMFISIFTHYCLEFSDSDSVAYIASNNITPTACDVNINSKLVNVDLYSAIITKVSNVLN